MVSKRLQILKYSILKNILLWVISEESNSTLMKGQGRLRTFKLNIRDIWNTRLPNNETVQFSKY